MLTKYEDYKNETITQIAKCLKTKACQPILFIGSGFSRRQFNGPSWDDLLSHLAKNCSKIEKDYAYYKQTYNGDMLKIGEAFAALYQDWAWEDGKTSFPEDMFNETIPPDAYIKFKISEYLKSITPKDLTSNSNERLKREIELIKSIKPHALITTNYDQFLELIFPEYTPIVGQQIIQSGSICVGEIFKIHGCVSDPNSLIFTHKDYAEFLKKKKYLSAKLLTFFTEHPLLFVGYSAKDPNIRAILSDIDEALAIEGSIIPNVYFLEWSQNISADIRPAQEKLIGIDDSKSVRLNSIVAQDFDWVFRAFASHQSIESVSPKVLRALLSRSYELVRHDIPRMNIQADFQMLEHAVENQTEFAKLFGITTINTHSYHAVNYPYTLSQLAAKLGFNHWTKANKIITRIEAQHGFDIKTYDNKYHYTIKYGKTLIQKYSEDAVILFKKIESGEEYVIENPDGKKIEVSGQKND